MTSAQFVRTLQLVDSMFPVGAFAYSDGLESAAASGRVHDVNTLSSWLEHFLRSVFVPCEGLALLKCIQAIERRDWKAVRDIDEELTALRPASATRASSKSIGKSLLTTYQSVTEDDSFSDFSGGLTQCNAAVAYAAVFCHRGLDCRESLLAFGYLRLAGIVSASLRLISIGQQQGQKILSKALDCLPAAVDAIMNTPTAPLRSFSPVVDSIQMSHRHLYSRIFRS
jgi:urease accessory protein